MADTACTACAAAQRDRHSAHYRNSCLGCQTRALAKSMTFFHAKRRGSISHEYRNALLAIFGDVTSGHAAVKAEADRLEAMS